MVSFTPPPGLAIRQSPHGHGRSLYATKAFRAGSLIAALTPPIMLPQSDSAVAVCAHCLSEAPSSSSSSSTSSAATDVDDDIVQQQQQQQQQQKKYARCTGCKSVTYCSKTCQSADWKRMHTKECKALRGLPGQLPSICRALVQALIMLRAGGGAAAWITDLESNIGAVAAAGGQRWFDIQVQARAVAGYVLGGGAGGVDGERDGTPEQQQLRRVAVEVLCKLQMNTFDRSGATGVSSAGAADTAGVFVDPTLSMANHSCVPNAGVQCVRRRAYLRAEADIKEGEEITISYIDYTDPRGARRKALAAYHFQCGCVRCSDNLTVYDTCRRPSLIDLNKGTLADPNELRNHPAPKTAVRKLANDAYAAYMRLQTSRFADLERSANTVHSPTDGLPVFDRCEPLMKDGFWALKPVGKLVNSGATAVYRQDKADVALALMCLEGTECLPYQHPDPFHITRIKNLSSLTRLLTETSTHTTQAAGGGDVSAEVELERFVAGIDRVVMCRMLLILLLRCTPEGPTGDWKDICEAGTSLHEIEENHTWDNDRREAGERISSWKRDPLADANAAWFQVAVMQPVRTLARLGARIMVEQKMCYVEPKDSSTDTFGPDDLGDC